MREELFLPKDRESFVRALRSFRLSKGVQFEQCVYNYIDNPDKKVYKSIVVVRDYKVHCNVPNGYKVTITRETEGHRLVYEPV